MSIKVGVGVLIFNAANEILLGKRISKHGFGTWACPGGHLELYETPLECAVRETQEETGLMISDLHKGPWVNTIFPQDNHHYLTVFIATRTYTGNVRACEPDKCAEWDWFALNNLPQPLFATIAMLIDEGKLLIPM